MSSILRALKKLENDQPPQTELQSWQRTMARQQEAGAHRRRPLPRFLFAGIVLFLCISLPLAGWLLGRNQTKQATPTTEITTQTAPLVAAVPQPMTLQPSRPAIPDVPVTLEQSGNVPANESIELNPVQPLPSLAPVIATEPPALPLVGATAENFSPDELNSNPAEDDEQDSEAPVQIPAPEESTESETIAASPPPPAAAVTSKSQTQLPEVTVLNDPQLKIEALVWSPNQARRFVVIAGRIVQEGEIVAGYTLNTIYKGGLLVQKNGKAGRVIFRLR